jgi:hypothetical protein
MRLRHLITAFALAAAAVLPAGAAAAADTPGIGAAIDVRPTPGDKPLDVTVTGSAFGSGTGAPVQGATFTYDFGDGSTPLVTTQTSVDHVYPAAGVYDPTVTAADATGTSDPAHVNMNRLVVGSGYDAVPGTRILDTRAAIGVPTRTPLRGDYGAIVLPVTGIGQVPATGVTSVVLNVTVTGGTRAGYLEIGAPDVGGGSSAVNWAPGQTIASQTTVRVEDGAIRITNGSPGSVHVIADVQGYYSQARGYRFRSYDPTRILDTRARVGVRTTTPVPAYGSLTLPISLPSYVPQDPQAVILNVTVAGSTRSGFLTAYGAGQPRPAVSSLDWSAGQVIANQVTVPVHDGKVTFANRSPGTVHIVADLNGYFAPSAQDSYRALFGAARVLDTRYAIGTASTGPVPAGSDVHLTFGLADDQGNTGTSGLMLHVTVTGPTASGVLIPADGYGGRFRNASVLNWTKGRTVADSLTQSNTNGGVVHFHNNSSGSVHLIVDITGYFELPVPQQID